MRTDTRRLNLCWLLAASAVWVGCQGTGSDSGKTDESLAGSSQLQTDNGTRLIGAAVSAPLCANGNAISGVSGTITSTGSVDSVVVTAVLDHGEPLVLGTLEPQDFVFDGREKSATFSYPITLANGEHTVEICYVQSGAEGRTEKAICSDALPVTAGCVPGAGYSEPPPACTASDLKVAGSVNAADAVLDFTDGQVAVLARHRYAPGEDGEGCPTEFDLAVTLPDGSCRIELTFGSFQGALGGVTRLIFSGDASCSALPTAARGHYTAPFGYGPFKVLGLRDVPRPAPRAACLPAIELTFPDQTLKLVPLGGGRPLTINLGGLKLGGLLFSSGFGLGQCVDTTACGAGTHDGGDGWCVAGGTCSPSHHACSGKCVSDESVSSCGPSCSPCPIPPHGRATCDGTACGVACDEGYHLCGTTCVLDTSTSACGSSCSPCANPQNGTATCNGTACGVACNTGFHECGGKCVSDTSPATCGSSCEACPGAVNATATCNGTSCGLACNTGFHACEGVCSSDASPLSCGGSCTPCVVPENGSATCLNGTCGIRCNTGFHACNGQCLPDNSIEACGNSCTPCTAPAHGTAVCTAGKCSAVCEPGYHLCGNQCVSDADVATCGSRCTACPGAPNASPSCVAGACSLSCNEGTHLCSGQCVSNNAVATCGSSCTPCVAPANGTATCSSGSCGFTCNPGYHACGNQCVSDSSPASCGKSCTPCAAPENASGTCTGGTCGFACNKGFHLCNGACVSDASPASCGASCTPCTAPANAVPACTSGACAFTCVAGFHKCGNECVPDTSVTACGASCTPCTAAHGQPLCSQGTCSAVCDPGYHLCNNQCVSDTDVATCGGSCTPCVVPQNGVATCDQGACGFTCKVGFHRCGNLCVSDTATATCGNSCTPCAAPTNASATCEQGTCGFACNAGYRACGRAGCVACPTVGVGSTRCEESQCVPSSCLPGYHLCGTTCVSDTSTDTCGNSCTPCTAPANGIPACSAGQCGFTCKPGFHACGDKCVSDSSVDSCGTSCSPCANVGNGSSTCGAGTCGYICNAGFVRCASGCCPVVDVAAQTTFNCALTAAGGVKCWGANGNGQLGDGTTVQRTTPVDVVGLSGGVAAVTTGGAHACALLTNGDLKCWGLNSFGQLGDATVTDKKTPSAVPANVCEEPPTRVSAGGQHTCLLTPAGGVKCWGDNRYGQLGDGTNDNRLVPVCVVGMCKDMVDVVASANHTCALTKNGGVKCWGYNRNGELGDGSMTDKKLPADVAGLNSGVVALSATYSHTCALLENGDVKCWGYNAYGQVGDGTLANRSMPVDIPGLGGAVSVVRAGGSHTCVVMKNTGVVKCWGRNHQNQTAEGGTLNRLAPTTVTALTTPAANLALGTAHTCALLVGGGVKCWGHNASGQLGDGTLVNRQTPVELQAR